eukprot:CAMPEP_0170523206 /NCGR_PEP_ID=MMETSP0209-20121228/8629_1 /TAXON_ID=665100 ORGANISM="Litonotus pictus, Strain P1" /NCGR_SAMPLE_ID=MMETSP0209 /ASSEMBLY_ACC=CAM_ASM_000301 /LENGTH=372 /DNA_ID=CAMNT_0010811163 /DNA_START=346 /DNA_END=1461 /DNA_ORIENTATION=+
MFKKLFSSQIVISELGSFLSFNESYYIDKLKSIKTFNYLGIVVIDDAGLLLRNQLGRIKSFISSLGENVKLSIITDKYVKDVNQYYKRFLCLPQILTRQIMNLSLERTSIQPVLFSEAITGDRLNKVFAVIQSLQVFSSMNVCVIAYCNKQESINEISESLDTGNVPHIVLRKEASTKDIENLIERYNRKRILTLVIEEGVWKVFPDRRTVSIVINYDLVYDRSNYYTYFRRIGRMSGEDVRETEVIDLVGYSKSAIDSHSSFVREFKQEYVIDLKASMNIDGASSIHKVLLAKLQIGVDDIQERLLKTSYESFTSNCVLPGSLKLKHQNIKGSSELTFYELQLFESMKRVYSTALKPLVSSIIEVESDTVD